MLNEFWGSEPVNQLHLLKVVSLNKYTHCLILCLDLWMKMLLPEAYRHLALQIISHGHNCLLSVRLTSLITLWDIITRNSQTDCSFQSLEKKTLTGS